MVAVNSVDNSQQNSAVAATSAKAPSAAETKEVAGFDAVLKKLLRPDGEDNVNEEDLFAALIEERISTLKGGEAATQFHAALEKQIKAHTRKDGAIPMETAARSALQDFLKEGKITAEEADKIHAQAFDAAQLDSNKEMLFDSTSGKNDPSRAVAALESALLGARVKVEAFDAGKEQATARKLMDTVSNNVAQTATAGSVTQRSTATSTAAAAAIGARVDGANGFLFKPVSERDGKLAVLLPPSMTGRIKSISLKTADGKKLEDGRFTSNGEGEGGRTKYAFRKSGEEYPKNIRVEVHLSGGKTKVYKIADPSKRYD